MKKLLIITMLLVSISLFAQQGVNVRIQRNGLDISDLSYYHFSAELVPGSGDFQYETDFSNGFNYIDIGMGTPNSYLNFDLANFTATWDPAMDFELKVWAGSNQEDNVSIILNCGFIAAGYSYYGWGFYGGDVPLQVPEQINGCYGYPIPFQGNDTISVGPLFNQGSGSGTGLLNEELLEVPGNLSIGSYFTITIVGGVSSHIYLCSEVAYGDYCEIPNLAYWINDSWSYVDLSWSGYPRICSFEIDPGSVTDVDVTIVMFEECWNPFPIISVDVGTPHSPGIGYGTGLPNEDLLSNPSSVGYYFTLTIDDSSPIDVTVCMDHVEAGYIPYNMAYWDNGIWTYVALIWENPGTANSCTTITIDPTSRANVDIPIVFANGPNPDDALPVELTNFAAINQQGEFVNVSWTTQSESNMSYYKVYREGQEIFQTSALNQVSEQVYSFVDIPEFDGTYYYTLEAVALDGTSAFWGPTEIIFGADVNEITEITQLGNNYPNPFNPTTTINFSVKENETGILTIFNAKGQVVTNETFFSGVHNYNWNADKFSSGIYFYKLQTGSFSEVKKMLLIK